MTFESSFRTLRTRLLEQQPVRVGTWHNVDVSASDQHQFRELFDVHLPYVVPPFVEALQADVQPNLPWAEDHFQERISGQPLNPPPSQAWWPFGNTRTHMDPNDKFSHTYPERFWPKNAGDYWSKYGLQAQGIRFRYGDLQDVVNLLRREPMTRQAYLPVWFPEDTGNTADVRLPCSLGYQFQIRGGLLRCTYTMRSVEFRRHFRDDVYMAGRLMQWVVSQLTHPANDDPRLLGLQPGMLLMQIANLHLLEGDVEWAMSA